jgi:hypothetical protein
MPQISAGRRRGLYGRRPFDPERPRLTLERYLDPRRKLTRAGLPPVPAAQDVDRASEVTDWPMYLNDQLGDCTIAGEGHFFGAMTRYASGTEVLFADSEIQAVYSRVGGYVPGDESTDNGCVMADVLADAKENGITDTGGHTHKLVGYAALGNCADEELLSQVLEVFGTVYVGFNVQQANETEFDQGQPWTYTPGATYIGGHCVVMQRRLGGSPQAPYEYVTWGAVQPADQLFQAYQVEEAWAAISRDWVRKNGTTVEGMDVQQLLADMTLV